MAISKILYMKDCGSSFHGRHLKKAINYVMNPEKTQDGKLIGAMNCQVDYAFEQMKQTKRNFNKLDKRQGYHIILSFVEDEIDSDKAFEITRRFVEEYLGDKYQTVFCVHDNTNHIHSHTIFNSVSFLDGKKYRYEKGDWAKEIQVIINRLCKEFGVSTIDINMDEGQKRDYDWKEYRDGKFVWSDMIARDLDACILQASNYEQFLELLQDKGYEIKQGKYLALRPQGMTRFKRCKTLGEQYSDEKLQSRIITENLSFYQKTKEDVKPEIVRCCVKKYRRGKLSGLQKKYYAKLYRIGTLKKKSYSQVYKYRNEIKQMGKLQEQYLFLVRYDIRTVEDLAIRVDHLTNKKKNASKEKNKVYKACTKCKTLFDIADRLEELKPAENSYMAGDEFFLEEHNQFVELEEKLQAEGYSLEEVEKLKDYYKQQYSLVSSNEKKIFKELNLGKSIMTDKVSDAENITIEDKAKEEKIIEKVKEKQPTR